MMKAVVFLVAVVLMVACAQAALTTKQYQYMFTRFIENFDKQYETRDVLQRFAVFQTNLDFIIESNQQLKSFKMGVNQFTDMTAEEFAATMTLKVSQQQEEKKNGQFDAEIVNAMKNIKIQAVEEVNWIPYAQAVKNQASCGSCWAFGANAVIEAQAAINTNNKTYINLSEQQQVDCNRDCSGCNGGLPEPAMNFAKNTGLALTKDYPYKGNDGSCNKSAEIALKVTKFVSVIGNRDCVNHVDAIQKGAINIGVAAGNSCFQFYSSGVLTLDECPASKVGRQDHAVALFALYEDAKAGATFYLRNSWGASWGENGYMRIAAAGNVANICTATYDRQVTDVQVF